MGFVSALSPTTEILENTRRRGLILASLGAVGFSGKAIIVKLAYRYGVDPFSAQGVLVTAVGQGFAQQIGLQPGDFVRQINGRKITDTADLAAALQSQPGAWSLVIQRGDSMITARFQG